MKKSLSELTEKGINLQRSGKLNEAASLFHKICEVEPTDDNAWMRLGNIYSELGDIEASIEYLKVSILINPGLAVAHIHLADMYRMQGDQYAAVSHLEVATRMKPDCYDAWVMLGSVYNEVGRHDLAKMSLGKAMEIQPNNKSAYVVLADACLSAGDRNGAVVVYEDLASRMPIDNQIQLGLGKAYLASHRYEDAESHIVKYISKNNGIAEAYYILAESLREQGKFDDALSAYLKTIELDERHADAYSFAAELCHYLGDIESALKYYKKSVGLRPDQPEVIHEIGCLLKKKGDVSGAEACFQSVIELNNTCLPAYINLASLYTEDNNFHAAIKCYQDALSKIPESAHINRLIGRTYCDAEEYQQAKIYLDKAIDLEPDNAWSYLYLAVIFQHEGAYEKALINYKTSLRFKSDIAETHCGQGHVLNKLGKQSDAVESFLHAIELKADFAEAYMGLASAYLVLQKPELARKYGEHAVQLSNTVDMRSKLAMIYDRTGGYEEAYKLVVQDLESNSENVNTILVFSSVCRRVGRDDEAVEYMKTLLRQDNLAASTRCALSFSLGRLYDQRKEYDLAFDCIHEGNRLSKKKFDLERHNLEVESLLNVFSMDYMQSAPTSGVRSSKPVFVIGMPRSGTTLVEQILSSHPDVCGAGELTEIDRLASSIHLQLGVNKQYPVCVKSLTDDVLDMSANLYLSRLEKLCPDVLRITDKLPGNYLHLGFIQLLFPSARIVHCIRNPVDTCLSCYFQDFSNGHEYSYDLETLAKYYKSYYKVMQHWLNVLRIPVLQIEYERLVVDQELYTRKLIEFCGLDWDDRCLKYFDSTRFVGTASYAQVTQPIYSSSVNRWKNYSRYIKPLLDGLGT